MVKVKVMAKFEGINLSYHLVKNHKKFFHSNLHFMNLLNYGKENLHTCIEKDENGKHSK